MRRRFTVCCRSYEEACSSGSPISSPWWAAPALTSPGDHWPRSRGGSAYDSECAWELTSGASAPWTCQAVILPAYLVGIGGTIVTPGSAANALRSYPASMTALTPLSWSLSKGQTGEALLSHIIPLFCAVSSRWIGRTCGVKLLKLAYFVGDRATLGGRQRWCRWLVVPPRGLPEYLFTGRAILEPFSLLKNALPPTRISDRIRTLTDDFRLLLHGKRAGVIFLRRTTKTFSTISDARTQLHHT